MYPAFGRTCLTLLAVLGRKRFKNERRRMCRVKCLLCGRRKQIQLRYFISGHTRSCGCARKRVYPVWRVKHGHHPRGRKTPTYYSFQAMHERCGNPKFPAYLNVRVCERWSGEHGFDHFLADCGLRKPGQTIGRMMDCGDYCAENARFMSQAEQQEEKKKKRRFIQNTLTNALRNGPYSKEKKRRKK